MDKRLQDLTKLRAYTENIEKEVALLLQNLQWSLNVSEKKTMVCCKYDANHRIPSDSKDYHEAQCHLKKLGYTKEDILLPEPVDPTAPTLVKFSKQETFEIIDKAAKADPLFRRGEGCRGPEPLSLARLQQAYSAAERGALHQAVVCSAPSCHDLAELDLTGCNDEKQNSRKKSRLEILAELRDMKRRRAKYRVPPKTRNYSDVLRDVIKTQMDSYGEAKGTVINTEYGPNKYVSQRDDRRNPDTHDVIIKLERDSPQSHSFDINSGKRNSYRSRSRDRKRDDDKRRQHKDYSFKNSRNCDTSHRGDRSRDRLHKQPYRSTDKSREKRHDGEYRYNDSSRDKNENYDEKHQREYSRDNSDRIRDVRHGAKRYHGHHSSKERKKYYEPSDLIKQEDDKVVKQETVIKQTEHRHNYNSDDSRDRLRDRATSNKKERTDKYDSQKNRLQRCSPDDIGKLGRRSPEGDSYHKGKASKRYKERSENDRRDHKRRHEDDKHSYEYEKEYERAKKRREFSGVAIKQERESP